MLPSHPKEYIFCFASLFISYNKIKFNTQTEPTETRQETVAHPLTPIAIVSDECVFVQFKRGHECRRCVYCYSCLHAFAN